MCGRYTMTSRDGRWLAERFATGGGSMPDEALGRFNVCPTEAVAIVAGDGGAPVARTARWGLVPPWATALRTGPEPINARAETVRVRRPFAALAARPERRCLVLADGWYEWLRAERGGDRTPFRYTVDGGAPFAFAGLWDERVLDGAPVASVTILTTTANTVCAPVHDRMPCVLAGPDEEALWLEGDDPAAVLAEALRPLDARRTAVAPANPAVNRAGVEGAGLLTVPPPLEEPQLRLAL
jgi:putative SOS response-associated peptidase YedK